MEQITIQAVTAREILDSRGNPTLEASVILSNGISGTAAVPSGASTGSHEALELRDGDTARYAGKGVEKAVNHVKSVIAEALCGKVCTPAAIDNILLTLDGTDDKSVLGANAVLGVSLAATKAAANAYGMPLYRYLGGIRAQRLPIPMMNILNGGVHAGNALDIQEFMILPVKFSSFREALRCGTEIYHVLGKLLKVGGVAAGVGDEGGFAPALATAEEALDYITEAIERAGYGGKVKIALDIAASEWYREDTYHLPKSGVVLSREDWTEHLTSLCAKYPIASIEDGMAEDDFAGWERLTNALGKKIMLVGDDLFVTNPERLKMGIAHKIANTVLIKPNQVGSLSETFEVLNLATDHGYKTILSHRSGETEDTTIADIAVASGCGFIKTGAPARGERTAKYNRLLRIEEELATSAKYYFP